MKSFFLAAAFAVCSVAATTSPGATITAPGCATASAGPDVVTRSDVAPTVSCTAAKLTAVYNKNATGAPSGASPTGGSGSGSGSGGSGSGNGNGSNGSGSGEPTPSQVVVGAGGKLEGSVAVVAVLAAAAAYVL